MKTIRQIADEIGVSKQTLQKRINREPLRTNIGQYTQLRGQTKYIDKTGEVLIKSAYNALDNTSDKSMDCPTETTDRLIAMLQMELSIKNKQIDDLSSALLAAQQTAAAAQALHAGAIKQLDGGELPLDGRTVPIEIDKTKGLKGSIKRFFRKEK